MGQFSIRLVGKILLQLLRFRDLTGAPILLIPPAILKNIISKQSAEKENTQNEATKKRFDASLLEKVSNARAIISKSKQWCLLGISVSPSCKRIAAQ
jgi:hypothetical protein